MFNEFVITIFIRLYQILMNQNAMWSLYGFKVIYLLFIFI